MESALRELREFELRGFSSHSQATAVETDSPVHPSETKHKQRWRWFEKSRGKKGWKNIKHTPHLRAQQKKRKKRLLGQQRRSEAENRRYLRNHVIKRMAQQDGLILHIMSYMTIDELSAKSRVCRNWKKLAKRTNKAKKKPFTSNSELRTAVWRYCSTDTSEQFKVKSVYGPTIGEWDVSNVTDFSFVFGSVRKNGPYHFFSSSCNPPPWSENFNEPIGGWDVTNATNMSHMFHGARSFNQSLAEWDTSQVTDMSYMFCDARSFNQSLTGWDVSSVSNMTGMFTFASSFMQPLEGWDTSHLWDYELRDGRFIDLRNSTVWWGMYGNAYLVPKCKCKFAWSNGKRHVSFADSTFGT